MYRNVINNATKTVGVVEDTYNKQFIVCDTREDHSGEPMEYRWGYSNYFPYRYHNNREEVLMQAIRRFLEKAGEIKEESITKRIERK